MSTARLALVSHGMTAALRAARFPHDEPLEDRALTAARSAVGLLRTPQHAHHDGSVRTVQTAEALGLAATPEPALADLDVGRWRGRSLGEVDPTELARWVTDTSAAPHGGESVDHLLERVAGWLDTLGPGTTVAVTHPAVVRAAVVGVLRAERLSFWRVDVSPLSTTTLHGRDGRWTLRTACEPLTRASRRRT
ncbi:histidine phosphatase family protein [Rhodococcus aerolatus]